MEPHPPEGGLRQRRHFGRRKGPALSAHQAGLLETLLPKLRIEPQSARDPRSYFSVAVSDLWFEIGFGGGEHLLWQARTNPGVGLIGAEPYVSGVAKLLSKLAPVQEELFFRGFLYRGLSTAIGPWVTILLTSAVWSVIHLQYNLFFLAEIFLLGVTFGWLRMRSGSTILTLLLHGTMNALAAGSAGAMIS